MKAARLFSLALLLAACGQSGEQDIGACRQEAQRAFTAAPGSEPGRLDELEKACMAGMGYRFSAVAADCGQGDPYENPHCYTK
jgi:hypothetical protein